MSEEQDHLAELLRSAAADAERTAPAFDVDKIVATAHRRRPWLALGAWLRSPSFPTAPAFALAAVVLVLAVGGALYATLGRGGGPQAAIGTTTTAPNGGSTTTTLTPPTTTVTTTSPPPTTVSQTTTTVPPPTTTTMPTVPPTSTTVPPTSTTAPTSTTTTTTTVPEFTYSVVWDGARVTIQPAANVDMAHLADARSEGAASGFLTDNPAYERLDGSSIEVWSAPAEFPDELVVNNSEQTSEPKGTWTFTG
jgi:hypothetical protein